MEVANTLAYYVTATITVAKKFYSTGHVVTQILPQCPKVLMIFYQGGILIPESCHRNNKMV
jgi:hypothetical protein